MGKVMVFRTKLQNVCIKKFSELGLVASAWKLSYSGGRDLENQDSRLTQAKSQLDPSQSNWCTSVIPATREAQVEESWSEAGPRQKYKTLPGK
jgi:hypothetical protein